MERIVYFEGARARRKYGGETALRIIADTTILRDRWRSKGVGRRWEISCNCDYVDRGGQAVDMLTRILHSGNTIRTHTLLNAGNHEKSGLLEDVLAFKMKRENRARRRDKTRGSHNWKRKRNWIKIKKRKITAVERSPPTRDPRASKRHCDLVIINEISDDYSK